MRHIYEYKKQVIFIKSKRRYGRKSSKRKVVTRWKFRRGIICAGWILLASSLCFGVYKNFTAIDKHTVYEKEIVVEKVKDTSGVENFVKNFATTYFTLSPDNDFKNDWVGKLEKYMQSDLVTFNNNMMNEVKENVSVQKVEVWSVTPLDDEGENFSVLFTIQQQIGDKKAESAYTVNVHSEQNSYVITKNPTVTSMPTKSMHEEPLLTSDDTIEASERDSITNFLTTFFTLYPKANEHELVYYVKDENISPLNKEYTFVSIDNVVIKLQEDGYKIACFVTYKDNTTQALLTNQYELLLSTQESGEFIIMEMR